MGQYEVDQFDPAPDLDLVCVICHCIFEDPLETPCHHIFCNSCINRWLERRLSCPTCRTRIITDMLDPAPVRIKSQLGLLTIRCANIDNGCRSISLEGYTDHKNNCAYEKLNCTFPNCEAHVLRRDLKEHEQDCEWRQVRCGKDCGLLFPIKERDDHNCVVALKASLAERNRLFEELQRRATELEELTTDLRARLTDVTRQLNQTVAFRDDMSESWVDDYDNDYDDQDWESIASQETTVLRSTNEVSVSLSDGGFQPVPPENVLEDDVITFNEWLHQIGANDIPEVYAPALTADTIMPVYNTTLMTASASNSTSGVVSAESGDSPHGSVNSWQDIQDVYDSPSSMPAMITDTSDNELEPARQLDGEQGVSSSRPFDDAHSEQNSLQRLHFENERSQLGGSRDRQDPFRDRSDSTDQSRSISPLRSASHGSLLTPGFGAWTDNFADWTDRERSFSRSSPRLRSGDDWSSRSRLRSRSRSRSRSHSRSRSRSRSLSRSRRRTRRARSRSSGSFSRFRSSRSISRHRSPSSPTWRSRSRSRSRRRSSRRLRRRRSHSDSEGDLRQSRYSPRSPSSWRSIYSNYQRSISPTPWSENGTLRTWSSSPHSSGRPWYERFSSHSRDEFSTTSGRSPYCGDDLSGHWGDDDQENTNCSDSRIAESIFNTSQTSEIHSSDAQEENINNCNDLISDGRPSDCSTPRAGIDDRGDPALSVIVLSDSDDVNDRSEPERSDGGRESCSDNSIDSPRYNTRSRSNVKRSRSPASGSPCNSQAESDDSDSTVRDDESGSDSKSLTINNSRQSSPAGSMHSSPRSENSSSPTRSLGDAHRSPYRSPSSNIRSHPSSPRSPGCASVGSTRDCLTSPRCTTAHDQSDNRRSCNSACNHSDCLRSPSHASVSNQPVSPTNSERLKQSPIDSTSDKGSDTTNGSAHGDVSQDQSGAHEPDTTTVSGQDDADPRSAPGADPCPDSREANAEESDSSGEESATERGRPWLASATPMRTETDSDRALNLDPGQLSNYVHGYVEYNLSNFVIRLQEALINQFTAVGVPPPPNGLAPPPANQGDNAEGALILPRTRNEVGEAREDGPAPITDVEVPGTNLLRALVESDSDSEGEDYVPDNDSSGDDTISEHLSSDVEEDSLSSSSDVHSNADSHASNHSERDLSYLMSNSCCSEESDSDWSPN